jgi:hypothetical protein
LWLNVRTVYDWSIPSVYLVLSHSYRLLLLRRTKGTTV